MIIPVDQLNTETLNAVIESFILREGTDYGMEECSLDDKIQQVKQQLSSGIIVLIYSELHETINIVPADQFNNV